MPPVIRTTGVAPNAGRLAGATTMGRSGAPGRIGAIRSCPWAAAANVIKAATPVSAAPVARLVMRFPPLAWPANRR